MQMKAYVILAACLASSTALAQVAADPTPPKKLEDASGSSAGEPATNQNRNAPQGRDTAVPRDRQSTTSTSGATSAASKTATPPVDPATHAPSAEAFIQKAAISDLYEIEAGNLAAMKGKNDDVKVFARDMVRDHTASSKKLKDAANGKPVPAKMDAEHTEMVNKLRTLEGREFDREYAAQQTKAHQDAVSLLRSYAENGTDKALKEFASDTLPKVEHHLEQARRMNGGPVNAVAR
jgi:putative membrane protein